jgi:2-methylisocitrate lyase-like PEP mutase family enzyme
MSFLSDIKGTKIPFAPLFSYKAALSYQDGEIISFDEYLKVIKNILSVISIPLSVDVESGFSKISII